MTRDGRGAVDGHVEEEATIAEVGAPVRWTVTEAAGEVASGIAETGSRGEEAEVETEVAGGTRGHGAADEMIEGGARSAGSETMVRVNGSWWKGG